MSRRKTAIIAGAIAATALLSGCASDAAMVSHNLSKAADNFEVERQIVFYNGITDSYVAEIIGRCSVQPTGPELEVTCKIGPNEFAKDYLGLSDNVTWFAHQTKTVDASVYHHRVILKPENVIPNFDLSVGKQ